MRQATTDRAIATWRYEQIAPFLDETLSATQKRRVRSGLCCRAVTWPNGATKPIPRTTLHRWIMAFRKHGFAGLAPKRRKDRGTPRRDTAEIVDYAIALLLERPDRSLFLLSRFLAQQFQDLDASRATLARHLKAHPSFATIEKLRGQIKKLRGRYQAQSVHESWQLDGKGPFRVKLTNGTVCRVHILSILDDYSRAVLAAVVTTAEDEISAIRVFQAAVRRYGLPSRMQFDRGSGFDSIAFRQGIAHLGVHRNFVKAKNPQAQGKIEAFNKSLERWFIAELEHQQVRDLAHLQELLDAFIAVIYQRHVHRELRATPESRLGGRASNRLVSEQDLSRAFFVTETAKSDRITGAVRLQNGRFVVPARFAGIRATFLYDPLRPFAALVTDAGETKLSPFLVKPLPPPVLPARDHQGGQLGRILDEFQGRRRDNTEPAFGLPEVMRAIAALVARRVPKDEREARLVVEFWRKYGPISKQPFLAACDAVRQRVGNGRALSTYLSHVARHIERARASSDNTKESS